MGLFTDIYNTVARFFSSQDEKEGDESKSVATNRLKLVLMQDRTNLTPRILEQMRGELVDLLSKYLEMDKELLELNFEQEGEQVALMLSIPVIRAKDEEEIEAILAKEAEEKAQDTEEADESDESDNIEDTDKDDDVETEVKEDSSETADNTDINNVNEEDNSQDSDLEQEESEQKKRHTKKSETQEEIVDETEEKSVEETV